MKKILIIMLFSILLLTGCNVEYNLNIDENLNINEYMTTEMTYQDYIPMLESKFNLQKEYLDKNNYKSEYSEEKIIVENNFNNYDKYLEHSKFYSQYFENLLITEKDNLIYIKTTGTFYKYVMNPSYEKYHIEETKINITLPFKVVSNNADSINKETGTYTWIITDETLDKSIELVFDKTKKNFKITPEMLYISLGIIAVLIILGIIIFMKKSSKNNEI